MTENKS